jgi:LysB family phage lysis regulatory protein
MELIVKSIIAALFVAVLGLVIYVQRGALIAAQDRVERAEQATRDRDGTIKTLTDTAARNKTAAAKLQAARDTIATTLSKRENLIESLQHENATIRSWADTSLPDAIVRLRDRPATTGADNLSQRLPGSDPLPAAGGGSQD